MDLFEGTIVEDQYVLYENALKGLPKHIAHAIGKSGGGRHSQVTSEPIHTHSKLHDTLHDKLKDHDGVHVLFHNDKPVAAVHSMWVAGKKNPDFTVSGHSHDQFVKHMNKGEAINHLVGRLATHASGDLKDKGTYARDKVELKTYHKDWIRDLKHDRREIKRKEGHDRLHDVRDRALDKLAQRHVGEAGSEIHRAKEIHKKLGKAIEDNDAEAIKHHSNELSDLTNEYKRAIKSLKNAKNDWSKKHARYLVHDVHARINTQEGRVEDRKLNLAETYVAMLESKIVKDDYEATSEPSQFGGHNPKVVHKKTGRVMYHGSARYKRPEDAEEHAAKYLEQYPSIGSKRGDFNEDVEQIDEAHVADGYHVVGGKDQRYHGFHRDADHAINHADALENSSGYVHQVHQTKGGKIVKTWQWSDPDQKFSSHNDWKGQDAHHILPPRLHEDVEQIDEAHVADGYHVVGGKDQRYHGFHRDADHAINHADSLEDSTGYVHQVHQTKGGKIVKTWQWSDPDQKFSPHNDWKGQDAHHILPPRLHEDVEQLDELSKKTLKNYITKSRANRDAEYDRFEKETNKRFPSSEDDDNAQKHFSNLEKQSSVLRKRTAGIDLAKKKLSTSQKKSKETKNYKDLAQHHYDLAQKSYSKAAPHQSRAELSNDWYGKSAQIAQKHIDAGDNHTNKADHYMSLYKKSSIKEDVELSDEELEKIEELLKGMDDEVDTEE